MDKPAGLILIVDDEPALLKMMSMYLTRLGYAVETSGSTDEARKRVEENPSGYAIAVLDATMPGLSLKETALDMLRASPALRVVAASGYPVDMSEMEAAGGRRVAFLPKPFAPEMLASLVRRMLAAEEENV